MSTRAEIAEPIVTPERHYLAACLLLHECADPAVIRRGATGINRRIALATAHLHAATVPPDVVAEARRFLEEEEKSKS